MPEETQERVVPASYKAYKAEFGITEDKSPETAADPKPQNELQEASAPAAEEPKVEKPETTDTSEKTEEKKPSAAPAKREAKTVETPDDSKEDTQEEKERKEKQRRDRTAEGKIKELTAAQTREKERADAQQARADKLERELEESRKSSAAKPAAEVKAETKPEAKPKVEKEDPRPSLAAIVKKAAEGVEPYAGKEYEELQDIHGVELDEWRDRENVRKDDARKAKQAEEAAEKQKTSEAERAATRTAEFKTKVAATKEKYSDFQTLLDEAVEEHPKLGNEGIAAAFNMCEDPGEVMYALSKNKGAEYARIAKMTPDQAYRAVMRLDGRLASGEAAPAEKPEKKEAAPDPPPEKQKPPVSKAPAPYVPVNGAEDPVAKKPSDYRSFKAKYNGEAGRPRA